MPVNPTPPRPRRDKPDNVVKFERRTPKDAPAAKKPLAQDWRRQIAGREGWVGLALIVLLAIALVAWNRLSRG